MTRWRKPTRAALKYSQAGAVAVFGKDDASFQLIQDMFYAKHDLQHHGLRRACVIRWTRRSCMTKAR